MARRTVSLPRKANDRLEMPPLVRTPGQRSLISGSASMKDFAYPLCSAIPVATASTFGSKMMSSAPAGLLREQVIGAAANSHLSFGRIGLALLVERHHHRAGAVALIFEAWSRKTSSPSLRLIELTTPLPWRHLRPAFEHGPLGAVDHHRDAGGLGLGRDQVEERGHRLLALEQVGVHVHVEHVRAAAHLVEGDGHRRLVVVGLDEPPELRRAGDVGPFPNHHEAGVRGDSNGSSPDSR